MVESATAKSLRSCTTLCDPRDGSPPGSAIPGILQARTRMGCHFLLQCMEVKSENEVAQSCPTLGNPMDCSLPGSSVHGIFQARVLEWGAIAFSEFIYYVPCNSYSTKFTHSKCTTHCFVVNSQSSTTITSSKRTHPH